MRTMFNEPYCAPPLEPPEGYYFETRAQELERRAREAQMQEETDDDK